MREVFPSSDSGSYIMSKSNYESEEKFWNAVATAMRFHTENEQEVWFKYEDCGNYVITYAFERNKNYGGPYIALCDDKEECYNTEEEEQ